MKTKRILSLMLASLLCIGVLATSAFAADDPTGFGIRDMSYEAAVIAVPAMNKVFDAANVLAGAVEIWSPLDGARYTDLPYGDASRGCQKYDLYVPNGLDANVPQGVLLFVHGGTWTMGEKGHMAWAAARYAKLGYIAATLNYDLASQGNDNVARVTGSKSNADVFDMLDDVGDCIAAIKAKCAELGYHVDSLAISGASAGSHIAALYAYSRAEESAIPIRMIFPVTAPISFHKGTFDNYTDDVIAQYASIVAGAELTEADITNPDARAQAILDSISPVSFIDADSVPTLLGYASADTVIGTNQYQTIQPVLAANGVDNDVVWWNNCDHTLVGDPGAMQRWNNAVEQWLAKYMPHRKALPFADVGIGAWYYDCVRDVYEKGLMLGVSDDRFAPDAEMTRAMFVTVLYRAAGEPDVSGLSVPFGDVPKGSWYHDAVLWAYGKGVTDGVSSSAFAPDAPITRAQLVTMLYRFEGAPAVSGSLPFRDSADVPGYARNALLWATQNGVLNGFEDSTVRPNATATRAQMAAILSRLDLS